MAAKERNREHKHGHKHGQDMDTYMGRAT